MKNSPLCPVSKQKCMGESFQDYSRFMNSELFLNSGFSTLINFLNNWVCYPLLFVHLGIANVNWVFNISNKYLFGYFGFSIVDFCKC